MDEALRQTTARGIDGWSLREVAAAVGVSHTAPYHHFEDRTDLVCALGSEGLDLMDLRMAERQAAASGDPKEQLLAIGLAYVTFAVDRPDYYAAIGAMASLPTDSEPTGEAPPEPGATWQRLLDAVVGCQHANRLPAGDPVVIAVSLWSLVHGLAGLWMAGPLRLLPHSGGGLVPLAERVLRASVDSMNPGARGAFQGESS